MASDAQTVLDQHRWKSMGVSSVECECGEVLHGDQSLTQFPADEAFRAHLAAVLEAEVIRPREREAGAAALREASVHLTRDHTMPPRKDSRGYDYRMGWWDGINKAGSVLDRLAREGGEDR